LPIIEDAKHIAETITGIGRPKSQEIALRPRKANTHLFRDDGKTPNNPKYPLIHYKSAVVLDPAYDPAAIIEVLFASNGWADSWRDGIYDFLHFHTRTHEVLGIARGRARVQFGGKRGRIIELKAGDVIVQPAGTGHQRKSQSKNLLVVGAYPKGKGGGKYDEPGPRQVDPDEARRAIAKVPRPRKDPVYGGRGPLRKIWT
jgi:uncharacterized protein YjlB